MIFFAVWICACLLELPMLRVLFGARLWPDGWVWLAHAASAALMFFALPKGARGWFSAGRPWGEALSLGTLALPGLGAWAAGALWLLRPRGHRRNAYFPDDTEELGEEPDRPAAGDMDGIWDVLPAVDAMLGNDPALKRGAIEALSKIRTPESISWILRARKDPQADVRFYATSMLTSIKRDYEQGMKAAERQALEKPMEIWPQLSLCRAGLDYALSGLLEDVSRRELLEKCRRWLLHLSERNDAALRLLYQVEKEMGNPQALERLETLSRRHLNEKTSLLKEKAALLFKLGRYGETKETMRALALELQEGSEFGIPSDSQEKEWQAALTWWT